MESSGTPKGNFPLRFSLGKDTGWLTKPKEKLNDEASEEQCQESSRISASGTLVVAPDGASIVVTHFQLAS